MKKELKKEGIVSVFKERYQELDKNFKSKEKQLDLEIRGMMLTILETKTSYLEGVDMQQMLDIIASIRFVLDFSCKDLKRWCYCLSELLNREDHCFQSLMIDSQGTLVHLGKIPSDYQEEPVVWSVTE